MVDSSKNTCENCGSPLYVNESQANDRKSKILGAGIGVVAGSVTLGIPGAVVGGILGHQAGKNPEELKENISKTTKEGRNLVKNIFETTVDKTKEVINDFEEGNFDKSDNSKVNVDINDEFDDENSLVNHEESTNTFKTPFNEGLDLGNIKLNQEDFSSEKLKKDKKLLELNIISKEEFDNLN